MVQFLPGSLPDLLVVAKVHGIWAGCGFVTLCLWQDTDDRSFLSRPFLNNTWYHIMIAMV